MTSLAIAFVLACSQVQQAALTPEELLAKMRQAYRETKVAAFQVKTTLNEGETLNLTLDATFANPNKMKVGIEGLPSGTVTVICDGKTVAVVADKKVMRTTEYSIDSLGRSLFANLETLCFFDWKRQLSTAEGGNMKTSKLLIKKEDWEGKPWLVLEEHAEAQKVDVRYFIDPQTYYIWRTVSTMIGQKEPFMDARIIKLELKSEIDPKTFEIPK